MSTVIRKSLYPLIAGMLVWVGLFLSTESAQAQCDSLTITNNVGCDLVLCLYNASTAAHLCSPIIPPGGTAVIYPPAGWVPSGGVSQGGIRYPFSATGCTVCYRQITSTAVRCCAEVCYDPIACTITVRPCSTAVCNP